MSAIVCYFTIYDGGYPLKCYLNTVVTGTRIIQGRNQPFMGIDVVVQKQTFNSESYWKSVGVDVDSLGGCPKPIPGDTVFHVETYGGIYDVVYTQTVEDDQGNYTLICYSKAYLLKNMQINSLIKDIHWWTEKGEDMPSKIDLDQGVLHLRFGSDSQNDSTYLIPDLSKSPYVSQHLIPSDLNYKTQISNVYSNEFVVGRLVKSSRGIPPKQSTLGKFRLIVPLYNVTSSAKGKVYASGHEDSFYTIYPKIAQDGAIFSGNGYSSVYIWNGYRWVEASTDPIPSTVTPEHITEEYVSVVGSNPQNGSILIDDEISASFIYVYGRWGKIQTSLSKYPSAVLSLAYNALTGSNPVNSSRLINPVLDGTMYSGIHIYKGGQWYTVDTRELTPQSPSQQELFEQYSNLVGSQLISQDITEAFVEQVGRLPELGQVAVDGYVGGVYECTQTGQQATQVQWQSYGYDKGKIPIKAFNLDSTLPKGWIYVSLVFTYQGIASDKQIWNLQQGEEHDFVHPKTRHEIFNPGTGETEIIEDDSQSLGILSMEVESVIGYTQDIFAFMQHNVGEYVYEDVKIDVGVLTEMTIRDQTLRKLTQDRNTFYLDEIDQIQNEGKSYATLEWGDKLAHIDSGANCWEALNSFTLSTGRYPVFQEKAFLLSQHNRGGFVNNNFDEGAIVCSYDDRETNMISSINLNLNTLGKSKTFGVLVIGYEYESDILVGFTKYAIYYNYPYNTNPLNGDYCSYNDKTSEGELDIIPKYEGKYILCGKYKGNKSYFIQYFDYDESDNQSNFSVLDLTYNSDEGQYCAYQIPYSSNTMNEYKQIPLGSDIVNQDQGATYLISKQRVQFDENIRTQSIAEVDTEIVAEDISLPIKEYAINRYILPKSRDVANRVGAQSLFRNAIPSDSLYFIALENKANIEDVDIYVTAYMTGDKPTGGQLGGLPDPQTIQDGTVYAQSGVDDNNLYIVKNRKWQKFEGKEGTPIPNYSSCVIIGPFIRYYKTYIEGMGWIDGLYGSGVNRVAIFNTDSTVRAVFNARSRTTLYNVPLAYTVLSWPDNSTKYMFGRPSFEDTEEQLSKLQELAVKTVTNTTISSQLSDSKTSSISINSIYLGDEDITSAIEGGTYTGLLVSKNNSTGQSAIDGYRDGKRQVRFSSEGEISCGTVYSINGYELGDSVLMNRDGFFTRAWVDETGQEEQYIPLGQWEIQCSIGTDGKITAAGGQITLGYNGFILYDQQKSYHIIEINQNGLFTRSQNNVIQCSIGTDGQITQGQGQIKLNGEGLKTFDITDLNTPQCSIGTNGRMVAGKGAVILSQDGIRIDGSKTNTPTPFAYYLQSDSTTPFVKMTEGGQVVLGNTVNGWTMIDYSGMKLYGKGGDPSDPGTSREPMVWVDTNGYHMNVAKLQDKSVVYMSKVSENETTPPGDLWEVLGVPSSYDSTKQYAVGDIVQYNIDIFYCKSAVEQGGGNAPPYDQEHWEFVPQFQNEETYDENSLVYLSSADAAEINYGTWANFITEDDTIRANVNLMSNVRLNAGPVCAVYNAPGDETIYYSVELSSQGLKTFHYEYDEDTEKGHEGYSKNVVPTTQCTVGTNGWITAGAGQVALNSEGLTTFKLQYKYKREGNEWVEDGLFQDPNPDGKVDQTFNVLATPIGKDDIEYVYYDESGNQHAYMCADDRAPSYESYESGKQYNKGDFALYKGVIMYSLVTNTLTPSDIETSQYPYEATTSYFEGSYCVNSVNNIYNLYESKHDNNVGNSTSNTYWWTFIGQANWCCGDRIFEAERVDFVEGPKYKICFPRKQGSTGVPRTIYGAEYYFFLDAYDNDKEADRRILINGNTVTYKFDDHKRQCFIGTNGKMVAGSEGAYVQIDADGLTIQGTQIDNARITSSKIQWGDSSIFGNSSKIDIKTPVLNLTHYDGAQKVVMFVDGSISSTVEINSPLANLTTVNATTVNATTLSGNLQWSYITSKPDAVDGLQWTDNSRTQIGHSWSMQAAGKQGQSYYIPEISWDKYGHITGATSNKYPIYAPQGWGSLGQFLRSTGGAWPAWVSTLSKPEINNTLDIVNSQGIYKYCYQPLLKQTTGLDYAANGSEYNIINLFGYSNASDLSGRSFLISVRDSRSNVRFATVSVSFPTLSQNIPYEIYSSITVVCNEQYSGTPWNGLIRFDIYGTSTTLKMQGRSWRTSSSGNTNWEDDGNWRFCGQKEIPHGPTN